MLAVAVLLAQLTIAAQAPDTVVAGAPFTLVIEVSASGDGLPRVSLPDLAPFVREGLRTSSRSGTSPATGAWVTGEYRLVLRTDQPGTHVVPPIEARLGAQWAQSRPLTIVVSVQPGAAPSPPAVLTAAEIDTSQIVNFHVMIAPDTVYVGQQATYQVGLFVEERARARLRRNPEFIAPEMRGMLAYDLPLARRRLPQRTVGPRRYDAHVYERAVFPLHAGRHVIQPARLIYALPQGTSFFSREESHEMLSEPVVLIVQDPPAAGRPDDFTGVVGDVRIGARVDSAGARAGDPLMLTVSVSGEGNVKFFQRPAIEIDWADLVPANERVELDSTLPVVRGTKEFDWILTPRVAGELELPAFRYSYFDPSSRRYEVTFSEADTLTVRPGTLAREAGKPEEPALAIRPLDRGAGRIPLHDTPLFRMLILLAPLPALSLLLVRRRPRRRVERRSHRRLLQDLARQRGPGDARAIRRAFLGALADRLSVPPFPSARRGGLARILRRAGVSASVAGRAEALLNELDAAAYSTGGEISEDAARRAEGVVDAVAREARPGEGSPGGLPLATVLILLLAYPAGLASAQPGQPTSFERGVEAYAERRYTDAHREFGLVVERTPTSADAWANFGTASFAAGDTAGAVVGWHRALRLQPLAADVRSRLHQVRPMTATDPGWIPPVPRWLLPGLAAMLWVVAWAFLAVRIRSGARWARDWAAATGAMALLAAGAAVQIENRIAARGLVVVASHGPLRSLPAMAADGPAIARAGEVARIDDHGGEWARVVLPDGRAGWIERQRLISLVAR